MSIMVFFVKYSVFLFTVFQLLLLQHQDWNTSSSSFLDLGSNVLVSRIQYQELSLLIKTLASTFPSVSEVTSWSVCPLSPSDSKARNCHRFCQVLQWQKKKKYEYRIKTENMFLLNCVRIDVQFDTKGSKIVWDSGIMVLWQWRLSELLFGDILLGSVFQGGDDLSLRYHLKDDRNWASWSRSSECQTSHLSWAHKCSPCQ